MSENLAPAPAPAVAKIVVPNAAIDALARPLSVTNSVGEASIDFYRAALAAVGIDFDTLSPVEVVEATRRLYAISADFRKDRAADARAEREAAAAVAKAARDAEREKRAKEEIAKIEKRLASLRAK